MSKFSNGLSPEGSEFSANQTPVSNAQTLKQRFRKVFQKFRKTESESRCDRLKMGPLLGGAFEIRLKSVWVEIVCKVYRLILEGSRNGLFSGNSRQYSLFPNTQTLKQGYCKYIEREKRKRVYTHTHTCPVYRYIGGAFERLAFENAFSSLPVEPLRVSRGVEGIRGGRA